MDTLKNKLTQLFAKETGNGGITAEFDPSRITFEVGLGDRYEDMLYISAIGYYQDVIDAEDMELHVTITCKPWGDIAMQVESTSPFTVYTSVLYVRLQLLTEVDQLFSDKQELAQLIQTLKEIKTKENYYE